MKINEIKTPFFLIYQDKLDKNIDDFKYALNKLWPNHKLSYSVKTNSLPWVLKYLLSKNVSAEVVSEEEYNLVKKCGFNDRDIIFNGPIKGKEIFFNALNEEAIVNIDSRTELDYLKRYANTIKENIGVRINPNPDIFNRSDIGYHEDGFRFGFSDETGELEKAINIITEKYHSFGLHVHCNSVTRSQAVYESLAEYTCQIIKKYNLKPSYIDIGGGFFGGVPGKTTPYEYILTIKNILERCIDINSTTLIVEPGSAIIGSAVDLVTSVVDIKDTVKSRIVTTDGSRIHIDPLWSKNSYMYSLISAKDSTIGKQIICGYTCMDHDRLMSIDDEKELSIDDKVIYHRVGAYTMTFGGMFINYYPDVYVKTEDNQLTKVRNKSTMEDYYNIHS